VPKKLYRSPADRILGGVCGGLAQYLGVDTNLVRAGFLAFALLTGVGVIVYLVLWLLVPLEGETPTTPKEVAAAGAAEIADKAREIGQTFKQWGWGPAGWVGLVLMVLGILLLLRNLGVLGWWGKVWAVVWPVLLVILGLALLLHRRER